MLSPALKAKIASLAPEPFRQNADEVKALLNALAVNENSCFAQFYLNYVGAFVAPNQAVELLEITDIVRPNIMEMTEYFSEHYGLPPRCVALSDDDFGVLWLYHLDRDWVAEINLDGVERLDDLADEPFAQAACLRKWHSFAAFLHEFFQAKAA